MHSVYQTLSTFYPTDAATTVGIITLRIMTPSTKISKVDTHNDIDLNEALSWVGRVVVVVVCGYLKVGLYVAKFDS